MGVNMLKIHTSHLELVLTPNPFLYIRISNALQMKNIIYILLFIPLALFGQVPISYQLSSGWNMVGYTGCEITPIEEAIDNALDNSAGISNTFEIIKDVRGIFWHPELGENSSLTYLTPGEGYMMYVNGGTATTVSFSEEYCNDITYQLNSGWNMVGFTGTADNNGLVEQMDAALGNGASTSNTFQVIKNASGHFWAPIIDLLGSFTPGEAYMMFVNEGQQTTLSFTENSTQVFENNPGLEFTLPTTDNNMSIVFSSGLLDDFIGQEIYAEINGQIVSEYTAINVNGSVGLAVIGADSFSGTDNSCGCDYASSGDLLSFAILMNGESIVNIDVDPPINFHGWSYENISGYGMFFSVEGNPVVFGCTDYNYLEFNPSANIDDGSCEVLTIYGCTDSEACNYYSEANFDDGSCLYLDYEQSLFNACCLENSITTICLLDEDICSGEDVDCITYGCTELWADNYDPFITQDDGSCYKMGCTSDWADNYDAIATTDDGSCDKLGCTLDWADNFDEIATTNDGSCYKYGCVYDWADNYDAIATTDDGGCDRLGCTDTIADNYDYLATIDDSSCYRYGCMSNWADNYDSNATIDDGSCYKYGCTNVYALNYDEFVTNDNGTCEYEIITQLTLSNDAWNIYINLDEGWNMFGYGCPNPIDVVEGLSNHTDKISLVKDNDGSVYIPEFSFDGIGNLTPGFGYQIKLTDAIEGFSLCENYINDVSANDLESILEELSSNSDSLLQMNNNIVSLQEENANLENEVANLESELDSIYGCTYSWACNFDETASLDDGSCYNNDLGCGCDVPGPIEGLDCAGNELPQYQVGDYAEGGIVFYVDSTGENGLVAAMESLGSFEWGCYGIDINGNNSSVSPELWAIGTGSQNTLAIVAGCSEIPIAASEALAYVSEGYDDWYLPSFDELELIYYTIGNGGPEGNIGGFGGGYFWSSTEYNNINAAYVQFTNDDSGGDPKEFPRNVGVIRAFGYTQGCMDETACNNNPEAIIADGSCEYPEFDCEGNIVDGSCEYPEQGFDCEGNITEYIVGIEAEGGIVFYVDETGEHGLVAALQDIGVVNHTFEWGCYGTSIDGANGTTIGTGYQNTLDIVADCTETSIAASLALTYVSGGYDDWYLPSFDELAEMHNTIGNGGPEGNVDGFEDDWYWSSSEYNYDRAEVIGFDSGYSGSRVKSDTNRVRVIRSF